LLTKAYRKVYGSIPSSSANMTLVYVIPFASILNEGKSMRTRVVLQGFVVLLVAYAYATSIAALM
jgi:hypothetical protein